MLIGLFALVVAGGGVYLFRPEPTIETDFYPSPEASPVDNTIDWPPKQNNNMKEIKSINKIVRVTLKTSLGDIKIALDGTRAPKTVGNFISLAEEDFYDGTTWHRVIPDFMIQGGDPLSKDQDQRERHGTGGAGYQFEDEINAQSYKLHEAKLVDVVDPRQLASLTDAAKAMTVQEFYEAQGYKYSTKFESLPMKRGILAMANSGPNTNGSQFFIITAPEVSHLAGKHTPFGLVEEGMDVVNKISATPTDERDNPIEPVIINDVEIDMGPADALKTVE